MSQTSDVLYMNHAATSFPKAPGVVEAVAEHLRSVAGSAGRGGHTFAAGTELLLWETRRELNALFGTREATRWVFTCNATDAINTALKGYLRPGGHVLASALEHNAVARCLRYLGQTAGVDVTRLPYVPGIGADASDIARLVRPDTRLVVITHASNVTGEILPIEDLAQAAHEQGVPVLVDAAQSAGVLDLSVEQQELDMVACTGHKSLLGPPGTGALYVRPGLEVVPLRHGGTGSQSELDTQPTRWPDAMESGTPNGPGLAGLKVALQWVREQTPEVLRRREVELMRQLIEGLADVPGVEIYGPRNAEQRVGLVSINIAQEDPAWVAQELEERGILTRSGLHCAPWAHEALGTLQRGTCRLSVGPFTTVEDIERVVKAVAEVAKIALA
ncbi:MAG: aminotransferase class V-fold PLP-dependent enzyme [Armatimonadetes bacterium]|nr:aminotransferase class V-fold PLP-dependent enzyme [Armatimonadota bacterium]